MIGYLWLGMIFFKMEVWVWWIEYRFIMKHL
jgi:hypothetical protein